ncbi:DUF674 family protein [Senna tora]|uniref:DUF674 family protein n=1 Tax=Senna tora TaxID=362788 RepID=A0A834XHX7_9FABA|nr:DUF674 family protein [Senna tora]
MGKESMQWDFIVMDDLQVTSCSSTSSLSVLQKLNVPLEDLVEHDLCIGENEIDHEEMISSMKDLNSKIKRLSEKVEFPDAAYEQKLGPGEAIAKRDKCEGAYCLI